jgi:hypothetical protein
LVAQSSVFRRFPAQSSPCSNILQGSSHQAHPAHDMFDRRGLVKLCCVAPMFSSTIFEDTPIISLTSNASFTSQECLKAFKVKADPSLACPKGTCICDASGTRIFQFRILLTTTIVGKEPRTRNPARCLLCSAVKPELRVTIRAPLVSIGRLLKQ